MLSLNKTVLLATILLLAGLASNCKNDEQKPIDFGDSDENTDMDSDTGTGSSGPCNGSCTADGTGEYTTCTCDPADPCGWSNDGTCHIHCLESGLVDFMFDDFLDCDYGCESAPWDSDWTYGLDYEEGPYGFKCSVCGPEENEFWIENGDTIPDVCLPNTDGLPTCLSDFYQNPEYDILFVDFSAGWCPPCQFAAEGEHAFLEHLRGQGWNPAWITILSEGFTFGSPPTLEEAAYFKSYFSIEGEVLYDAQKIWTQDWIYDAWLFEPLRGFPTIFMVHNSNMLIWYATSGWIDPNTTDWPIWLGQVSDLLTWCSAQPGAIHVSVPDAGVDGGDTDTGTI